METLQTLSTLKSPEWLARMSHGAPATWAISWQRIRFSSPRTRSDPVRLRIFRPEPITGGATLAAWFRCGVLVQRSLRVFAPVRQGCPDPFPACYVRNYTVTGSDAIERRTSSVGYS